jgi:23S rRNA (adenine2030-N6)-methyltransferase
MLSYRHAFHAGNFADVLKHAVLAALIEAIKKKDTPFCYVDTHAGAGRYDLQSGAARKTGEYREGIARLWTRTDVPEALRSYLDAVRALNADGELRYYPGSPRLARHLLRAQDRMILMELHTTEHPLLQQEFAGDRQAAVHHVDGYQGLRAHLPPREKRGIVLIDPSYEVKTEFKQVVTALKNAYERWNTATLALWYPVLERSTVARLERALHSSGMREILLAELCVADDDAPPGMHGCGMIVVRPPWKFDVQLRALLPWLWDALASERRGGTRVEWIVGE